MVLGAKHPNCPSDAIARIATMISRDVHISSFLVASAGGRVIDRPTNFNPIPNYYDSSLFLTSADGRVIESSMRFEGIPNYHATQSAKLHG